MSLGRNPLMSRSVKETTPVLSVVVAVREAEETIGRDVRKIAEHLRNVRISFEILAVNDGCCDNSFALLQLLASRIPELRLCVGDAAGKAFVRGTAEAHGEMVALVEAGRGSMPLAALSWAMSRLTKTDDAVVFRNRCIVGKRMACLPAIVRSNGRGDLFERSFERNARGLHVDVI